MICCIHLTMLMYILSNFFSGFLIFNIKKVVCGKQFVLIYKSKDILNAIQYVFFFFWIFCHINLKFVFELKYPHSNFSLINCPQFILTNAVYSFPGSISLIYKERLAHLSMQALWLWKSLIYQHKPATRTLPLIRASLSYLFWPIIKYWLYRNMCICYSKV